MIKITVAICTYNRERFLKQLFDSINRQSLDKSSFEVVLINNNSPGNTKEIFTLFCKENPTIKTVYSEETKQGLSFSRNHAISLAKSPLITFLDDDAFIEEHYLENCLVAFSNNSNIVALGGKILLHYEGIIPKWENKYLNSLLGYFNLGDLPFTFSKKNYPRGSNMTFSLKVFEKIGVFNTSLGRTDRSMIGGEEKELFDRIYSANLEVLYEPKIIVFHSVPEERTKTAFIRRQAIGIGMSERVRTLSNGGALFLLRILKEIYLWMASIVLWIFFSLKLQFSKGNMILAFRWWLTQGLLGWKKE
jgi:glycosyltransferase involved in cell wall biosynthesis